MWVIAGILSALGFVAWVAWAAYEALILVRPRSKERVDRWIARLPAKGLRRAMGRAMRWWLYYDYPVRHPDGSIGPAVDYTWTRLGRDLRRAGSRLVSLARR